MKINLNVTLSGDFYEREVDWPAVPRVGELVLLVGEDSGWSEPVKRVWWDVLDTAPTVELGTVNDVHDEDLRGELRKAGWE